MQNIKDIIKTCSVEFQAKQAYREGLSQHDNTYPLGDKNRVRWGLAMHECEHEEFKQLMRGFA